VSEPSRADALLTQALKQALALLDGQVLDHFVIVDTDSISFAERALL
jgi:DNA repair protein RadC